MLHLDGRTIEDFEDYLYNRESGNIWTSASHNRLSGSNEIPQYTGLAIDRTPKRGQIQQSRTVKDSACITQEGSVHLDSRKPWLHADIVPERVYDVHFEQITADAENIVSGNLDYITQKLAGKVLPNGSIVGRVDVQSTENIPPMCSHPVYKVIFTDEERNSIELIIKVGEDSAVSTLQQQYAKDSNLNVPRVVYDGTFEGIGQVMASEYVEGQDLHDILSNGKYMGELKEAVRQVAYLQHASRDDSELEDVIMNNASYFTNRVDDALDKFLKYSERFLGGKSIQRMKTLRKDIVSSYSVINAKLSTGTAEMHSDASPKNIRLSTNGSINLIDAISSRKYANAGLVSLVSLLEFGRKDISRFNLLMGRTEYLTAAEKKELVDHYIDERSAHSGVNVTDALRAESYLKLNYAQLQRHIEYMGYEARDMAVVGPKNVFNEHYRQRFHMHSAVKALKTILRSDDSLTSEDRGSLKALLKNLKNLSNVVCSQDVGRENISLN